MNPTTAILAGEALGVLVMLAPFALAAWLFWLFLTGRA